MYLTPKQTQAPLNKHRPTTWHYEEYEQYVKSQTNKFTQYMYYLLNFEYVKSLNGISQWKRGKSKWLKKFVRLTLRKKLALLEPSWQEQQECTQINNEGARNPSDHNRNTVNK